MVHIAITTTHGAALGDIMIDIMVGIMIDIIIVKRRLRVQPPTHLMVDGHRRLPTRLAAPGQFAHPLRGLEPPPPLLELSTTRGEPIHLAAVVGSLPPIRGFKESRFIWGQGL